MDLISLMTDVGRTKIDSRYRLVILAAQRARQLMLGSRPQIHTKYTKEVTIALDEALQEKIEYVTGEEARIALKEARQLQEAMPKPKAFVGGSRDESEIRKDLTQYLDDSRQEEPATGGEE